MGWWRQLEVEIYDARQIAMRKQATATGLQKPAEKQFLTPEQAKISLLVACRKKYGPGSAEYSNMNRQLDLLARGKLDASSAAGQLSLTLSALLDEDPPLRKVLLVAVGKKDGSMDAKTDSSDGEWTKHTSKS